VNAMKVCVLVTLTVLPGCGGCDYSVDLPNGYRLIRTNAATVVIYPPEDVRLKKFHGEAVPARITGLNDTNGIVYGRVEQSPDSDTGVTQTPGYFILDTKLNVVWLGLDEKEWRRILKENGVEQPQALVQPSRSYRMHK
jgi:hypothetical protein